MKSLESRQKSKKGLPDKKGGLSVFDDGAILTHKPSRGTSGYPGRVLLNRGNYFHLAPPSLREKVRCVFDKRNLSGCPDFSLQWSFKSYIQPSDSYLSMGNMRNERDSRNTRMASSEVLNDFFCESVDRFDSREGRNNLKGNGNLTAAAYRMSEQAIAILQIKAKKTPGNPTDKSVYVDGGRERATIAGEAVCLDFNESCSSSLSRMTPHPYMRKYRGAGNKVVCRKTKKQKNEDLNNLQEVSC